MAPRQTQHTGERNSTGQQPGEQEWGWETNARDGNRDRLRDDRRSRARTRDRHAGYGDYGTREYGPRHESPRHESNDLPEPSDPRPRDFRDYGRGNYSPSAAGDAGGADAVGPGGFGDLETTRSYRGRGPRNYTRSDERIREIICERLTDDAYVDASDVTVEVKNGEVTLSGSVRDRRMKHRIEDIADDCVRGKDIHNQVRVTREG